MKKVGKFLRKAILFTFIILLSASFVIYLGGSTEPLTAEAQEVGRVGNYIIKNSRDSDFTRNYEIVLTRYQRALENQSIDQETLNQIVIREAFIETVVDYLIEQENKKNKIVVSDEQVIESIIELYFDGEREEYEDFIKSTTDVQVLKRIEKAARANALKKIYLEDLVGYSPISSVDYGINAELGRIQKKAVIGIITKDAVNDRFLDEDSLLNYYKANISRYQGLASVDLSTNSSANNGGQNGGQTGNSVASSSADNLNTANLSTALGLTNQGNPDAGNNVGNGQTLLSEQEIVEQFKNNEQTVRGDFLLENSEGFAQQFREEFDLTIAALNQKGGVVSDQQISSILEDLGFQSINTGFYSYNSSEIKGEENDLPIIRQRDVIRNMFLFPKDQVSPLADSGEFFFVSVNYEEEENEAEVSGFVRRQYESQIEEDFKERVTEEYYSFLIRTHSEEIYLFNQKLEI